MSPLLPFGVVFALEIESGGLEDRMTDVVTTRAHGFVVRQGSLKKHDVVLVISGAGRAGAAKATEAMIDVHRPGCVLSAGFAGGLSDALKRHDIFMADRLADTAGKQLSVDLKVDPASLSRRPGVHVGRLLTADRVIRQPDEKHSLGRQHEAMAVDMETFAVAEVCRRREVRFLAVRVINDTAGDELPPDIGHLLAQETLAGRLGAAVGSIWRRPSSFKEMYRLRENALLSSEHLAKFITLLQQQMC